MAYKKRLGTQTWIHCALFLDKMAYQKTGNTNLDTLCPFPGQNGLKKSLETQTWKHYAHFSYKMAYKITVRVWCVQLGFRV
jgi:hypothetical protein